MSKKSTPKKTIKCKCWEMLYDEIKAMRTVIKEEMAVADGKRPPLKGSGREGEFCQYRINELDKVLRLMGKIELNLGKPEGGVT